jgi:hypothetical protein
MMKLTSTWACWHGGGLIPGWWETTAVQSTVAGQYESLEESLK